MIEKEIAKQQKIKDKIRKDQEKDKRNTPITTHCWKYGKSHKHLSSVSDQVRFRINGMEKLELWNMDCKVREIMNMFQAMHPRTNIAGCMCQEKMEEKDYSA